MPQARGRGRGRGARGGKSPRVKKSLSAAAESEETDVEKVKSEEANVEEVKSEEADVEEMKSEEGVQDMESKEVGVQEVESDETGVQEVAYEKESAQESESEETGLEEVEREEDGVNLNQSVESSGQEEANQNRSIEDTFDEAMIQDVGNAGLSESNTSQVVKVQTTSTASGPIVAQEDVEMIAPAEVDSIENSLIVIEDSDDEMDTSTSSVQKTHSRRRNLLIHRLDNNAEVDVEMIFGTTNPVIADSAPWRIRLCPVSHEDMKQHTFGDFVRVYAISCEFRWNRGYRAFQVSPKKPPNSSSTVQIKPLKNFFGMLEIMVKSQDVVKVMNHILFNSNIFNSNNLTIQLHRSNQIQTKNVLEGKPKSHAEMEIESSENKHPSENLPPQPTLGVRINDIKQLRSQLKQPPSPRDASKEVLQIANCLYIHNVPSILPDDLLVAIFPRARFVSRTKGEHYDTVVFETASSQQSQKYLQIYESLTAPDGIQLELVTDSCTGAEMKKHLAEKSIDDRQKADRNEKSNAQQQQQQQGGKNRRLSSRGRHRTGRQRRLRTARQGQQRQSRTPQKGPRKQGQPLGWSGQTRNQARRLQNRSRPLPSSRNQPVPLRSTPVTTDRGLMGGFGQLPQDPLHAQMVQDLRMQVAESQRQLFLQSQLLQDPMMVGPQPTLATGGMFNSPFPEPSLLQGPTLDFSTGLLPGLSPRNLQATLRDTFPESYGMVSKQPARNRRRARSRRKPNRQSK